MTFNKYFNLHKLGHSSYIKHNPLWIYNITKIQSWNCIFIGIQSS